MAGNWRATAGTGYQWAPAGRECPVHQGSGHWQTSSGTVEHYRHHWAAGSTTGHSYQGTGHHQAAGSNRQQAPMDTMHPYWAPGTGHHWVAMGREHHHEPPYTTGHQQAPLGTWHSCRALGWGQGLLKIVWSVLNFWWLYYTNEFLSQGTKLQIHFECSPFIQLLKAQET